MIEQPPLIMKAEEQQNLPPTEEIWIGTHHVLPCVRRKIAASRLQICRLAQTHKQTAMPCFAEGINCLNQIMEEMND